MAKVVFPNGQDMYGSIKKCKAAGGEYRNNAEARTAAKSEGENLQREYGGTLTVVDAGVQGGCRNPDGEYIGNYGNKNAAGRRREK